VLLSHAARLSSSTLRALLSTRRANAVERGERALPRTLYVMLAPFARARARPGAF
jgi:hypothetical protein